MLKANLKTGNVDPELMEATAVDRALWRKTTAAFVNVRRKRATEKRELRKELRIVRQKQNRHAGSFLCSTCGRASASRIGLFSQQDAYMVPTSYVEIDGSSIINCISS